MLVYAVCYWPEEPCAQAHTGSLSALSVATANSKTGEMVRRASAATVGAPRLAVS